MTNREKYNFDFFTLENYERMIGLALDEGFEFQSYKTNYDWSKRIVLWRHDVEFSPYTALKMAKIEAAHGVKATYFFQTHAETYNLFERAISDIALEVQSLGHDVGLHFDSHYWKVSDPSRLDACIRADATCFVANLNILPKTFSFHCTDDFIKSCEDEQYGGLQNVYSRMFKTKFAYCADSTGFWRYERLDERLQDPSIRHLQVLTHEAMWNEAVFSPRKRVFAAIDERAQKTKEWYDRVLVEFGAKNIDDEDVR